MGVIFGVPDRWLLSLALEGILKATVLNGTPGVGDFAKNKLVCVVLVQTKTCFTLS